MPYIGNKPADTVVVQDDSISTAKIVNDAVTVDKVNLISTSSVPSIEAKGDGSVEGKIQFNCENNSHGQTIQASPHSSGQSWTLKLPDNSPTANKFLKVKSITGSGSTATGQLEFADAGGTTINNNADNRVITGSGTANTLEGEANLTFDGTNLDLPDSKLMRFGTGNDFSIQHNASNTILTHSGTGDLQIRVIDSGKACIFYNSDASSEILKLTDTNGYLVSPPTAGLSSGQSPNVYINSSGTFKKSTSALKYKTDVRDLESIDISSFRPVRYKSNIAEDETNEDFIGFIADEFHDAGLTELVSYGDDSDGKPTVVEGFNYDRMTAVLTKALQDANKKIETLEARVQALEKP